MVKLPCFL